MNMFNMFGRKEEGIPSIEQVADVPTTKEECTKRIKEILSKLDELELKKDLVTDDEEQIKVIKKLGEEAERLIDKTTNPGYFRQLVNGAMEKAYKK